MNWTEHYKTHTATAEEAVKLIQSGSRVVIGHTACEPSHVVEAMVANAAAYRDVEIVHMLSLGACAYAKAEYAGHFKLNTLFVSAPSREPVNSGRADFTPAFLFEVPDMMAGELRPDVALISVTPPDEDGYCSLGVSMDYTYAAAKNAGLVIAQVNGNMPFTCGPTTLHVSEIGCFVPFDAPIIEVPPAKIGPVEKAIGMYCASLVSDGDTLQVGIGAIPEATLQFLKDRRDLGIHSEMFSDGVMELLEAGVITNRKKTLHPEKSVATLLMGTRRLYDYVSHNPDVELYPADHLNHPMVIAQNDNMVSINSCLQVDLMGQVVSECIGSRQFSGVGGQVDFVRGAALSRGGRSIMAMSAATKGISKIVANIDPGAAVTTSRCDVDYVVTEYGVARLKGRSLRQRAEALIAIAHPDFRAELTAELQRRFPVVCHEKSKETIA